MRTTIRMDDHLLVSIKKLANKTGRTLTAVIEDALRETLARKNATSQKKKIILKTFKGKGLQPGVDLDHSASLADLMDSSHDFT